MSDCSYHDKGVTWNITMAVSLEKRTGAISWKYKSTGAMPWKVLGPWRTLPPPLLHACSLRSNNFSLSPSVRLNSSSHVTQNYANPVLQSWWRNALHIGPTSPGLLPKPSTYSLLVCLDFDPDFNCRYFQAQNIPPEKCTKVIHDIVNTMIANSFIDELFKPQVRYSFGMLG